VGASADHRRLSPPEPSTDLTGGRRPGVGRAASYPRTQSAPGPVDRDDVLMVEARGELRLDEEPLAEALVRRELRRPHVDGNLAPEVGVLRGEPASAVALDWRGGRAPEVERYVLIRWS
jgi:hypothetical protein